MFDENAKINLKDSQDDGLERILAKCQFHKTAQKKQKNSSITSDLIDQWIESLVQKRFEELVRTKLNNLEIQSGTQVKQAAHQHTEPKHLKLEQTVLKKSCSCGRSGIELNYKTPSSLTGYER